MMETDNMTEPSHPNRDPSQHSEQLLEPVGETTREIP